MKWINILWTIIVNIFLTLVVSITMEYLDLTLRVQQLENTISTSVETAIDTSMASEEFFTEAYSDLIYSQTGSLNKVNKTQRSASKIRWYNPGSVSGHGSWVTGMTYIMAGYYNQNGKSFPDTQHVYDGYAGGITDGKIFNWLYQKPNDNTYAGYLSNATIPGNEYRNTSLRWSSTNRRMYKALGGLSLPSDRTVAGSGTKNSFKKYFDNAGNQITMRTAVKVKTGASGDKFRVESKEVPTLSHMGIMLQLSGTDNLNSVTSTKINDNFIQATKIGKRRGSGHTAYSNYYLTPNSLGVTYIPIKVFEPVLKSHIQQTALFNRLISTDDGVDVVDTDYAEKIFDGGIGCMQTHIYPNGGDTPVSHGTWDTGYVVNDGEIEYDLDTIKIDVDYKAVDFYDEANKDVITRVIGSKASRSGETQEQTLENTVESLRDSDTVNANTRGSNPGNRLLARVTVRIKVNIPYHSAILQWLDYLKGGSMRAKSHYGVKMWKPEINYMDEDSDGVWYQYTTYRAISR